MPSLISTVNPEILPLWDSFEAVFFVTAGVSIGFVLGYLFPSLWRTFRRRFRKSKNYAPSDIILTKDLNSKIKILGQLEETPEENSLEGKFELPQFTVAQSFVIARNFYQEGNLRQAVKIYLDILVNESVSKQDTNRALFELSQAYFVLGLFSKSYETAFDLLNRKPKDKIVFDFLLDLLGKIKSKKTSLKTMHAFKGFYDVQIQKKSVHHLCTLGEAELEQNKFNDASDIARHSLQIDASSPRAMILLIQSVSLEMQEQSKDVNDFWIGLGVLLDSWIKICEDTQVSTAAIAQYLWTTLNSAALQMKKISNLQKFFFEFKNSFDFNKLTDGAQKTLFDSIFYSFLLLEDSHALKNEQDRTGILTLICGEHFFLQKLSEYIDSPRFNSVLKLGFSIHQCVSCSNYHRSFKWTCPFCKAYESLVPVVSPYVELMSNANQSRDTHPKYRN